MTIVPRIKTLLPKDPPPLHKEESEDKEEDEKEEREKRKEPRYLTLPKEGKVRFSSDSTLGHKMERQN